MNKISVLIPSYNHTQWINQAVDSVLTQTYQNIEVIIVDDCSSDGSQSIIKELAKKDSRIIYKLLPENIGAVLAMKEAFLLSSGEYVATISSDDTWCKDKLQKQIEMLNSSNYGAVFTKVHFVNQYGKAKKKQKNMFNVPKEINIQNRESILRFFALRGNFLCHPSVLIKKECYLEYGFYDPRFRSLPDFDFWVRLLFKYDISIIDEPLVNFRIHTYNESGESNINNLKRCMYEHTCILLTYFNNIITIQQLKGIFPIESAFIKIEDDRLTQFYLSQIFLQNGGIPQKHCALNQMFKLLQDKTLTGLLFQHKLYSYTQYSKDIEQSNIHRIQPKKIKRFLKNISIALGIS